MNKLTMFTTPFMYQMTDGDKDAKAEVRSINGSTPLRHCYRQYSTPDCFLLQSATYRIEVNP